MLSSGCKTHKSRVGQYDSAAGSSLGHCFSYWWLVGNEGNSSRCHPYLVHVVNVFPYSLLSKFC